MLKERGVSVSTGQGSKAHNTQHTAHSTPLAGARLAFHINVSTVCSPASANTLSTSDCTIFMYLDVYFCFLEFKRKYSQLLTFWEQLNLSRVTGKLHSIGVQALSGQSRKMLTLRLTTLLLPKTVLFSESFARLCIVLHSKSSLSKEIR